MFLLESNSSCTRLEVSLRLLICSSLWPDRNWGQTVFFWEAGTAHLSCESNVLTRLHSINVESNKSEKVLVATCINLTFLLIKHAYRISFTERQALRLAWSKWWSWSRDGIGIWRCWTKKRGLKNRGCSAAWCAVGDKRAKTAAQDEKFVCQTFGRALGVQ